MKLNGTYLDGFLLPVPTAKLESIASSPAEPLPFGQSTVPCTMWRLRPMTSTLTFAVLSSPPPEANEDETVIFAFAVFADKAARDAANAKIMADERMSSMCTETAAIFDCKRMAFGGFRAIVNA